MDDKPKVKILVVDDRQENLLAMSKLLKPLGAEVHKVDSGEAALSEVLHHHFAVILLDVQMPGMDGFETATLLHSNKQTSSIPIIFVTAINKDQAYISKGYQAGAVDYLPKPINPEILLGKVKVFLQLEEQRIELESVSKQLRWISRKNKLLLDHAGEGIAGLDRDGRISFINPTACDMLGGTEESLLGEHISQFVFNAEGEQALEKWQESQIRQDCMEGGGVFKTSDRQLWTLSRSNFAAEYNMAAIVNEKQEVQGGVLLFQDITERKKLEEQLVQMAKYDSLTGLANRTLFREFLSASLARSQRRDKSTAVMYLDLDHFKEINDTLGHDAGDLLLKSVSERLQECVREGDLVARLGGDEFAIILDDVAEASDAKLIAEKILTKIREPHDLDGEERHVGTSIGIATSEDTGSDAEALLKAADEAMYVAKKNGRNDYRLASELNSEEKAQAEQGS
ncbi:two-component system response regulator [Endozoicomonas arenosclerae]|uniref:two-component system response regulator n=1 Tax=Endozoicomonas arenosclerae TaxID=1633495 RepID=UPI000780BF9D|nr:diguanylate cyclase [Endozoicomonas arenosclerae]